MAYWRIRKDWNGGKWDKTQRGAFTSLESAISNFKEEYKNEGYYIFSPEGEIVYPYHELTQMMLNDGVSLDEKYWDDTFNKSRVISYDYGVDVLKQYSNLLKEAKSISEKLKVIKHNDLEIYQVPAALVKVKIVDAFKKNLDYSSYCNAGFFAGYKEADGNVMVNFTLPVANLVADYSFDDLPEISHKYWKERKYTENKMYFGANENGPQFYGKEVSTLIIKEDNSIDIIRVNDIKTVENIKYAVSGYPIILNYNNVEYANALAEGWQSGVTRNTSHPFVGIKEDGYLYLFGLTTTRTGKYMTEEVISKVTNFGFKSLIKLDGGGSTIIKINNENKLMTSENRRINSIITLG